MNAKATVTTCVYLRSLPASWPRPRVSDGLYMTPEPNEITSNCTWVTPLAHHGHFTQDTGRVPAV